MISFGQRLRRELLEQIKTLNLLNYQEKVSWGGGSVGLKPLMQNSMFSPANWETKRHKKISKQYKEKEMEQKRIKKRDNWRHEKRRCCCTNV